MLYFMTMNKQHLSTNDVFIHKLEQFIEALDILSTVHSPITLISPFELTYVYILVCGFNYASFNISLFTTQVETFL